MHHSQCVVSITKQQQQVVYDLSRHLHPLLAILGLELGDDDLRRTHFAINHSRSLLSLSSPGTNVSRYTAHKYIGTYITAETQKLHSSSMTWFPQHVCDMQPTIKLNTSTLSESRNRLSVTLFIKSYTTTYSKI